MNTRVRLRLGRLLLLLWVGLACTTYLFPAVPNAQAQSPLAGDYVPNEILVAIKPGYMAYLRTQALTPQASGFPDLDRVNRGLGVLQMTPLTAGNTMLSEYGSLSRTFKIRLPPGSNLQEALAEFQRQPFVEYAEPNYIYQALWVPNDPEYQYQWALPKIAAPQAWDLTRGSPQVIIAVLDTGVNYNHPDLSGKVLTDRDYDFVNNDEDAMDDNGHGTHVAGIAAAATNNNQGIAGVCPECKILPVKVLDATGSGSDSSVASGIAYAVQHGAKVINLSLGGPVCSKTLANAINAAFEHGVLIVAASGNSFNKTALYYPAALSRVLSVGATDSEDRETRYSNRSPDLDILAPGDSILSTMWSSYGYLSGTSMAAPHVAAAAGLLWSLHPEWKQTQVWWALRNSADPVTLYTVSGSIPQEDIQPLAAWRLFLPVIMKGGLGRLNLYGALQVTSPQEFSPGLATCPN